MVLSGEESALSNHAKFWGDATPSSGFMENLSRSKYAKGKAGAYPFEIRSVTDAIGMGTFAKSHITSGTVMVSEHPVVQMPDHGNDGRVLACSRCQCAVSDLRTQLNRMLGHDASGCVLLFPGIGRSAGPKYTNSTLRECPNHCGAVWCSQACYDTDFEDNSHQIMCGFAAKCKPDSTSRKFYEHALTTDHAFFLVAQVYLR